MKPSYRTVAGILLLAVFFLAGCAQPPLTPNQPDAEHPVWRGRLALRVDSEPPQSFAAGFELAGNAHAGELTLSSPFGNTIAVMRWTPQVATLRSNGETRRFESLDALATQATGTALPIAALFQWLAGQDAITDGWQADLARLGEGRLLARRTRPEPLTELLLIFEP